MSKDKEAKRKVRNKILAQHLKAYEDETSPRGEIIQVTYGISSNQLLA